MEILYKMNSASLNLEGKPCSFNGILFKQHTGKAGGNKLKQE